MTASYCADATAYRPPRPAAPPRVISAAPLRP